MAFTRIRLWLRSFTHSQETREGRERVRRVRPTLEGLEDRIVPTPLPLLVTSSTDDGTGQINTLSWAIETVNANPGTSYIINFAINRTQGTAETITVTGAEPAIAQSVTINGYSQRGNNSIGGAPWVELKGPGAGAGFNGLTVNSGGVLIEGLAIDDFMSDGIVLNDPGVAAGNGDTVQGCYIGTNLTGTLAGIGNNDGITVSGSNNTIGGLTGDKGNLISGNTFQGINISGVGANQNVAQNNTIGLDATGLAKLPNGINGVLISGGASHNTIGGTNTYQPLGNVISGNDGNGIGIAAANNNCVYGNSIGVLYNGSTMMGNTLAGVALGSDATGNFIGGLPGTGTGNVISGNGEDGVLVTAAIQQNYNANNTIVGNSIGVTSDGSSADPNGWNGVEINAVIGTSVEDNVISGNTQNGVQITGDITDGLAIATASAVTGNKIGTTANGAARLGNGQNGIYVYLADNNTIGGATQGTQQNPIPSNVISGNVLYGVEIAGSSNLVVNNYIGTDVSGKQQIGNRTGGVNIGFSTALFGLVFPPPSNVAATDNTIGGTGGLNATLNVISGNQGSNGNTGNGISLWNSGVQNTLIEGNYIGMDVTGLNPLGNQNGGVAVFETAGGNGPANTTIGVVGANGGNVISANQGTWLQAGIEASAGTGIYQNNIIGYNSQGKDPTPNKDFNNKPAEVDLPANGWTDGGGNLEQ